jgi:hypothetical protein
MGHVLRQCLIALRLAGRSGLDEQARGAVYYTALLVNVGCHADAHEQAKWFGDDIALKSGKYLHELGSVRGALAAMRLVGAGNPPLYRFRVGLEFALSGRREVDGMIAQHARLARTLAEQLGLPAGVREAVGAAYEQWDGRGWPGELGGEAVPVAARIAAEPALAVELSPEELDGALRAIANFVDLKSPFTLGHSVAVAELAERAGCTLGLPTAQTELLRRAGLVHGYGLLGVSNSILDRPGPLSVGEWERVRMSPYLTERILHQSPALAPLGEIARCSSASGWTAAVTRGGFPAGRSRYRPACSVPPTRTRRCASRGRTGPRGRRATPWRNCAPRSGPAGSTAQPSMRCLTRPAIGCRAAGRRPRA